MGYGDMKGKATGPGFKPGASGNPHGRVSAVKALQEAMGIRTTVLAAELIRQAWKWMIDPNTDPRLRGLAFAFLVERVAQMPKVKEIVAVEKATYSDSEIVEEAIDVMRAMPPAEREKILTEIDHPGANVTDQ